MAIWTSLHHSHTEVLEYEIYLNVTCTLCYVVRIIYSFHIYFSHCYYYCLWLRCLSIANKSRLDWFYRDNMESLISVNIIDSD